MAANVPDWLPGKCTSHQVVATSDFQAPETIEFPARHFDMGIQFLGEIFQGVFVVVGVAVFTLVKLAPRYPHVPWLQAFRHMDRRSEEQKQRDSRRANIMGGLQLIVFGIAIPPAYVVLDAMMWSTTSQLEIAIVSAVALVCIAVGVTAIVRARRPAARLNTFQSRADGFHR